MLVQKGDFDDPYLYRLERFKSLKFGTSGLRDEDSNLTDIQVYVSTKGFLDYLFSISENEGGIKKGSKIALAGDFRPSTPRILYAVSVAILDSGCFVDYCGRIPTPALSLWGFYNKIPSIMVTASHNPYGQNGIKFIKPNSEVMKEEEKPILEKIQIIREVEYRKSWEESMFDKNGFFKNFYDINDANTALLLIRASKVLKDDFINHSAKEFYVERYKKVFGKILSGEKIVFYEQTCVGREVIPKIFFELGADVILEGRVDETKEFVPVDTEDMKKSILEKMAEIAVKHNRFITITADGDSDRPAVVLVRKDNFGNHKYKDGKPHYYFLKGDKLNVLASIFIRPDYVCAPASVSHKPIELLKKLGIKVKLTKVGSPHVIKEMINKRNNSKEDMFIYGFEGNGGGIMVSDKRFFDDVILNSLPTRDPTLPVLCTLILAKTKGLDLEDLLKEIFSGEYESHHHSGLVENISGVSITEGCERYSSEIGKKIIEFFLPLNKEIVEIEFVEGKVFGLDYNQNEILIDRDNQLKIMKVKEILTKYVRDAVNSYEVDIIKINYIDGIKIFLSNQEILHFRPSGNASQFRIYAEAINEERAIEIVERAIKPKVGTLVKLINDFIDGKIN
ncbi:MAG: hypothetical protein QXW97_02150 [Candidatus Pacearchaeota archaeon]